MRIGLTGTMSVGKTTLVEALKKSDKFKHYKFATERSKYLNDLGIPLNTDSTLKGQTVFLAERCAELLNKNVITDRTVIDVMAFTQKANSIEFKDKKLFEDYAKRFISEYDYVLYIPMEGVELEDNGVRCIDEDYRNKIDFAIKQVIKFYGTEAKNVISIPPRLTVEERVAFIEGNTPTIYL
tara:strand:- start:2007 stop:2552 length:546 start_codon:yes stop_codon:yes gene_type:complete